MLNFKKIFLFFFLISLLFSLVFPYHQAFAKFSKIRVNPDREDAWYCQQKGEFVWECLGTCRYCSDENVCQFTSAKPCQVGWLNNNPDCACCGDCSLDDFLWIGANVANIIFRYMGVVALVLFVIGGIIWMTSGGAPEKIGLGKNIIKGAVIGLIIIIGSSFIIDTVLDAIGASEYVPSEPAQGWPICPSPPTKTRPWCYGCTWTGVDRGCQSQEVADYQELLNELGYDCGPADGKFGPKTKECTKEFQRDEGLTADGIVGPDTYEKYLEKEAESLDVDFDLDFDLEP